MSVLELTDEQVVSLVRQLPAARKRDALLALAQESQSAVMSGYVSGKCNYVAFVPNAGWTGIACQKINVKNL